MTGGADEGSARKLPIDLPRTLAWGELVLRPLALEEEPLLSALVLRNLEHLRPWMPWIRLEPMPAGERRALLGRWQALIDERTDWPVGLFSSGRLVGTAGLHQRRRAGVLEVGYWVDRATTGKGVASRTTFLLTDLAFHASDARSVEVWCDKANLASSGVPARVGFVLAEEIPADPDPGSRSPGEVGIDCRWEMRREQWQAEGRDRALERLGE